MHKVLTSVLLERQSQYTTTISQDERLLDDDEIKGRYRMAIEVRLGEKSIIAEALAYLKKGREQFLNRPHKGFLAKVNAQNRRREKSETAIPQRKRRKR